MRVDNCVLKVLAFFGALGLEQALQAISGQLGAHSSLHIVVCARSSVPGTACFHAQVSAGDAVGVHVSPVGRSEKRGKMT